MSHKRKLSFEVSFYEYYDYQSFLKREINPKYYIYNVSLAVYLSPIFTIFFQSEN